MEKIIISEGRLLNIFLRFFSFLFPSFLVFMAWHDLGAHSHKSSADLGTVSSISLPFQPTFCFPCAVSQPPFQPQQKNYSPVVN